MKNFAYGAIFGPQNCFERIPHCGSEGKNDGYLCTAQRVRGTERVNELSNWISSLVAVKKPGKLIMCIDLKDLNKVLKRNRYYIKTLDEILPNLAKVKVFSVLDETAKDGYHQIELDNESSY